MKISTLFATLQTVRADAIAIFIPETKSFYTSQIDLLRKTVGKRIDHIIKMENFKGKDTEILSLLTEGKIPSPRLILVGLGDQKKLTMERLRSTSARASKFAKSLKINHLALFLPDDFDSDKKPDIVSTAGALVEGAYLSVYKYDKYLTDKERKNNKFNRITIVIRQREHEKQIKKIVEEKIIISEAVSFARNLANAPGNELYPESLSAHARNSAKKYNYKCTVWDKKRVKQEAFGGLLAVNSGSSQPPRFIVLEHNSAKKDTPTVVLVGKGITFDSGGISIKPSAGMAEMKMDMSGAAAVMGTMEAVARLKLPIHLIGLVPATENMPGSSAMRPGDIITHYGGKTSEVDNTDAEGRLILADALAYASRFKPDTVIDLATLTGACVVALGHYASGMMGNDDGLMEKIKVAGENTYERVWQLPMYDEYEKLIKSEIADVKNVGGRWGGAITAAFFLKKFIGDYKWVHLDIAGTAMLEEDLPYTPKGGSGVGVRLLVELLKNWK